MTFIFLDFLTCQVAAGVRISISFSLRLSLQAVGRGLKTTLGFPGMATGYDQSNVWGFLQTWEAE